MNWLQDYYTHRGAGIMGRFSCFTWVPSLRQLKPVHYPDPVTFDDLVGLEFQKETLIRNTRQFLSGLPANNILLYGDRGTGKSSLVRALNRQFAAEGLRLIEINKDDLEDFPFIVEFLRTRGLKFILYVDDLSFEAGESRYKNLKALLEGGLETRPANVLIYATSNRRHLIKESFEDRDDDLHGNDTIQERLSLADRFGITLTFSAPDQDEYLEIVQELAAQRGLEIAPDTLAARAVRWELEHNGRSGRTAKQFVDQLEGELELEKA